MELPAKVDVEVIVDDVEYFSYHNFVLGIAELKVKQTRLWLLAILEKFLPELTSINFECLSRVANGKSGFFSSTGASCGCEYFSKAFANPLSFVSLSGAGSDFSILSQNPRVTAKELSAARWTGRL